MELFRKTIATPLGPMVAAATDDGICILDFPNRNTISNIFLRATDHFQTSFTEGEHPFFSVLELQLKEYFEGIRKEFQLPLHLIGTPFQQRVWQALQTIPYGNTRSYKAQSVLLGNEKAIRAVARANGENGLAIVVPCHRVIGAHGSLVGYAGGLRRKQWLLEHEQKNSGSMMQQSLFTNPL